MIKKRKDIINRLQAQIPAYFLAGCMLFQTLVPVMVQASVVRDTIIPTVSGPGSAAVLNSDLISTDKGVLPAVAVEKENVVYLPGGPDQPEVQSFSPVGMDNMVDPFTGDFSYNISLLDVDGYPINIAYSAGVTMDQEASWVGLGWNLNPGVINRHLRGLPDDFNGDKVTKEFNMKKNWTAGVSVGASLETFAFDFMGLSASLGINYNNYNGFGSEISVAPSFGVSGKQGNMGASLGISGNSQSGASLSPNLSFSRSKKRDDGNSLSKGINIGTSLNSRGGLSNLTVGYTRSAGKMYDKHNQKAKAKTTLRSYSMGSSSSFNFGMSTYTPQITMPLSSYSFTARFRLGPDAIGFDGTVDLSGYFSSQWLKTKMKEEQAYGYMNLQYGQFNPSGMLDFNRENDGSFTKNTPALPVPSLTYDIYSVSGHGVSGSYRIYRTDIGHVFDPKITNNSTTNSVGAEVGLGATFKAGVDIAATYTSSRSSPWNDYTNAAASKVRFSSNDLQFREANELSVETDPSHFDKIGGSEAVRFRNMGTRSLLNMLEKVSGFPIAPVSDYGKSGQDKRNQVLYTLSNAELQQGMGVESIHPQAYSNTNPDVGHHIGQFTTLTTEGTRYVYGIAAYSHKQENASFAVGAAPGSPALIANCAEGRVSYSSADASVNNSRGTDNHYNAEILPPFAHSYLLTSVLDADYVDADEIKGPSKGDLGGYLRFEYKKIDNYKWRNPVNEYEAFYDEGLNADKGDDKGHFIYGEKELWYVEKIYSKNHVAVFYTSERSDGKSVNGRHGGVPAGAPGPVSMQVLDSIKLYSLPDYEANPATAIPVKSVHFDYDYSLCKGYDMNNDATTEGGKLTLKSIYFTYEHSHKGRYTPYVFEYGFNPDYDLKSVDRWGTYKAKPVSCSNDIEVGDLRPSDFPYTGFNKAQTDEWAAAWALSTIQLPSGGKIEIDYESDDYAYVQHKRARQMFKIIGVEGQSPSNDVQNISSTGFENKPVYFEMIPGTNIQDYGRYGDMVYFRALMKFDDNRYDFVPGYAQISEITTGTYDGVPCGKLILQAARLMDNGSSQYNPISVAAIQFGRLHLSRMLPPSSQNSIDGEGPVFLDIAKALAGAFTSFQELFTGPNLPLWKDDIGTHLVRNKSWVRLQNPDKQKLGGGHRVKEVRIYDAWDELSGSGEEAHYGQQYSYTLEDGSSSGVASYEPQLGGDENAWRTPVAGKIEYALAPDIRNYQETPFGEQFFPSPSVGYSRVTIKNIPREGVTRTATGKVVHRFYTSQDYPTIAARTSISAIPYKTKAFAVFFSMNIDEISASQGFVVENNDMHGKPKSQEVYAEGQPKPISKVEYFYQDEQVVVDGIEVRHLRNEVSAIRKNGTITTSIVGRTYEAVADFRSTTSKMTSGSVDINLNYTLPFILVPMILGSGSFEDTEFRSAVFVKTIERKGILSRTVATDLGSEVETNNLAYDAETGEVLLTQTTTDFNDRVYNFTYPAHWYYDGMGQAYKNVGHMRTGSISFSNGATSALNASNCSVGDEVGVIQSGVFKHGWVTAVSSSSAKVLLKDGTPLQGSASKVKILRSGRKNLQNTPIGTLVLRENPLSGLTSNIFEKVLQAGVVEYVDEWGTFCECFTDEELEHATTNPYVLGLKGNWRPKASYVHLSGRTQTFENANSNIREDGVFTSFTPFYKLSREGWNIDRRDWTYTSSVTEFSPFGQPLETVDALDRYSASQYGYNQALQIAASANTRYRQLGFDGFEDYDFENCSDNHFKVGLEAEIVSDESHSGRRSLEITAGTPVVYSAQIVEDCDKQEGCEFTADMDVSENVRIYKDLTGTAPYQFNVQNISGPVYYELTTPGIDVFSTYPATGHYILTITDANGCIYQSEQIINLGD